MLFSDLIHTITKQTETGDNSISDGQFICRYTDIPEALKTMERFLFQQGIQEKDCLAVECLNTLPCVLLLLTLLKLEIGFMPIPPVGKAAGWSPTSVVPEFCQYLLTIKQVEDKKTWIQRPEQFVTIKPMKPKSIRKSFESKGKLFFRTSGSLGKSKIVVHSQSQWLGNVNNCRERYQFTPADRVFLPAPIVHSYGFGTGLLASIMSGASLCLQEKSNLIHFLEMEKMFQPTMAIVTPNLCEMVLLGKKTVRPYKIIISSGQRFKKEVFYAFDRLCGNRLVNQYGCTEMGAISSSNSEDPVELRCDRIGRPMNGVLLKIKEREEQPIVYCQHPFGYLGYMDEAGMWRSKARQWYRTGDIAQKDKKGLIEIVGREGLCLNRSGYLVSIIEIEKELEQLPFIKKIIIAVTKFEDLQGQKLVACCVLNQKGNMTEAEVLASFSSLLPNYAAPDDVLLLPDLPLLTNGKIDRQLVTKLAEDKMTQTQSNEPK